MWAALLAGLWAASLYSYLLIHAQAEIFTIAVAVAMFFLLWNRREQIDNGYLVFIGIAYLFVAGVDLAHTLAYRGMGVFAGYDANPATQLWIAARYMQSISLLIAPFVMSNKLSPKLILASYSVAFGLLLTSILVLGWFPVCYIEGSGLTPFKKASEYIISLILLAAVVLLWRKRREFEPDVLRRLTWSLLATIGSEIAFTFYVSVYDFSNLMGHMLKIVAFYLVYRAIIETGLVRPYDLIFRRLKLSEATLQELNRKLEQQIEALTRSEQRVRAILSNAPLILYATDQHGAIEFEDGKGLVALGSKPSEHFGQSLFELYADQPQIGEHLRRVLAGESHRAMADYHGLVFEAFYTPLLDSQERVAGALIVWFDISERQRAAEEREELIHDLQEALAQVKTLRGMLPICSSCKKIRDDRGYWHSVETYVREHSEVEFTHGLCPDCLHRLYPDLAMKPDS